VAGDSLFLNNNNIVAKQLPVRQSCHHWLLARNEPARGRATQPITGLQTDDDSRAIDHRPLGPDGRFPGSALFARSVVWLRRRR